MANAINLSQKTFLLVSGASRGIGRSIAIECAAKLAAGSEVVLLARSKSGLEETKSQILSRNSNVSVIVYPIDLTRPSSDDLTAICRSTLECELAVVIHNVGTIGDITNSTRALGSNIGLWQDYYSLNLFSVFALNTAFLDRFQQSRILVVNLSSESGIDPYKNLSLYCSGKAAREMYFRALALEENELTVINYSPGGVDTDMLVEFETNTASEEIRSLMKELRHKNLILRPAQTALKLIEIIEKGNYKSGDHTRYWE